MSIAFHSLFVRTMCALSVSVGLFSSQVQAEADRSGSNNPGVDVTSSFRASKTIVGAIERMFEIQGDSASEIPALDTAETHRLLMSHPRLYKQGLHLLFDALNDLYLDQMSYASCVVLPTLKDCRESAKSVSSADMSRHRGNLARLRAVLKVVKDIVLNPDLGDENVMTYRTVLVETLRIRPSQLRTLGVLMGYEDEAVRKDAFFIVSSLVALEKVFLPNILGGVLSARSWRGYSNILQLVKRMKFGREVMTTDVAVLLYLMKLDIDRFSEVDMPKDMKRESLQIIETFFTTQTPFTYKFKVDPDGSVVVQTYLRSSP